MFLFDRKHSRRSVFLSYESHPLSPNWLFWQREGPFDHMVLIIRACGSTQTHHLWKCIRTWHVELTPLCLIKIELDTDRQLLYWSDTYSQQIWTLFSVWPANTFIVSSLPGPCLLTWLFAKTNFFLIIIIINNVHTIESIFFFSLLFLFC